MSALSVVNKCSTSSLRFPDEPDSSKASASIVSVTPEMAERFLGKNLRNRNVRAVVVNAYARDMKAGRWQLTGESIKFDTDGNLVDGQHRCRAIVASGQAVLMLVVRGVAPEAQEVMDSGIKRQAYDAFKIDGVKNPTIVAAVARYALRLAGSRGATNAEIKAWVDDNPSVHAAAAVASHYSDSIDLNPSVVGLAWLTLSQIDMAQAESFFSTIANNQTAGPGDPRNALIRRLASARRNNERLSQDAQFSAVLRAWNALRKGQSLNRLPMESRAGAIKIPKAV